MNTKNLSVELYNSKILQNIIMLLIIFLLFIVSFFIIKNNGNIKIDGNIEGNINASLDKVYIEGDMDVKGDLQLRNQFICGEGLKNCFDDKFKIEINGY